MGQIAQGNQHEHIFVVDDNLPEQFGVEVGEYLLQHYTTCLERSVSEKYPREAYEMESDYARQCLAQATRTVIPVVVKHISAEILMSSQRQTVHAAPSHEI